MKTRVGMVSAPMAASPTHPGLEPTLRTHTVPELQSSWNVVVMNDDVNGMIYVVHVFRQVFGYETEKARRHMLEVHNQGRSVVWSGGREAAEHYIHLLQQWHLRAQLESHV
ncbi:MAG TPA: ATP-dependent Clp protease adaptor ClpS [Opitutales bacterium]|nr:ATP-dependent Clp protease adaptor ClpS [Opitutales bacterium]